VSLTPDDVAKLAGLARIELTDAELTTMAGQLDIVLDAVAVVSSAPTDGVAPTSHALALTNVFRADEVRPSLPREAALAMAPAAEDDRFRVPRILDEE